MAASDARSTTASNNRLIYNLTGKHALVATANMVREGLRLKDPQMSEEELQTAVFLTTALEDRARLIANEQDTTQINQQIRLASSGLV